MLMLCHHILLSWVLQVEEHTSVHLCYFSFKLKIPRQALNDNIVNFYFSISRLHHHFDPLKLLTYWLLPQLVE